MTRLQLFIAFRYLFARKSHNVINIISAISSVGMAVGTAALILILSVYNGLDSVVREGMSVTEPDLLVRAGRGKTIRFSKAQDSLIRNVAGVVSVQPYISDNVFADYDGIQSLAVVKGVCDNYPGIIGLGRYVAEGNLSLHKGNLPQAVVGRALASSMKLSPRFVTGLKLYYPSGTFSAADPLNSLRSIRLFPSSTVSVNQDFDNRMILAPIGQVRELMALDEGEYSGVEIRTDGTTPVTRIRKAVSAILGNSMNVMTREEQNETLYKMLRGEKAMIFIILTFIIIVITFNIYGSLTMLIMEKEQDVTTLLAMGMRARTVRHVFVTEGWLISLLGILSGAIIGIALALAQQHFGFVKMPGNFILEAYPVVLKSTDVIISIGTVGFIGYIIALLPVRKCFKDK